MLHIHACCKHMFHVFSGVSYACLQVFHLDIAFVCNGFKCSSGIFTSVSYACFKCFIYLILYVATVVSVYFKSRSRCCTWDTRGKRPAARTTFGVAWAHCWCARERARRARRSLSPCAGSVWTLALGSDVRR